MGIYKERRTTETVCLSVYLAEVRFRTHNPVDVLSLILFDVSFVTINDCRRLQKNQSWLHHHHHHHHRRGNPCPVFLAREHIPTYSQEDSQAHVFTLPDRKSLCSCIQVCVYTYTSIILLCSCTYLPTPNQSKKDIPHPRDEYSHF